MTLANYWLAYREELLNRFGWPESAIQAQRLAFYAGAAVLCRELEASPLPGLTLAGMIHEVASFAESLGYEMPKPPSNGEPVN